MADEVESVEQGSDWLPMRVARLLRGEAKVWNGQTKPVVA